jgi:transcriptional regulator with XRE-family HTH domain
MPSEGESTKGPTFSDHIAAAIRAERARRRLTQAELAKQAGLSRTALADVEAGKRQVTANHLPAICRALGVPLSTLIREANPDDLRALGCDSRDIGHT